MKPYIKDLLIIALIILCFIIGCHWDKPSPPSEVVKGKETVRVDTVLATLSVDKPKPIITRSVDTMYLHDTIWCDSIRDYELNNDTIKINTSVQGRMLKQNVLYKMFNTSTTRVDTLIKKVNKPVYAPFISLRLDSSGNVKPSIGFLYGKGQLMFSGSIGFKEKSVGVYYRLGR